MGAPSRLLVSTTTAAQRFMTYLSRRATLACSSELSCESGLSFPGDYFTAVGPMPRGAPELNALGGNLARNMHLSSHPAPTERSSKGRYLA